MKTLINYAWLNYFLNKRQKILALLNTATVTMNIHRILRFCSMEVKVSPVT